MGVLTRMFQLLRHAAWLTGARARAYGLILLAITGLAVLIVVLRADGFKTPEGAVLGPDFVSFWTAGVLALRDGAAAVYDPARHFALQEQIFAPKDGYAAFFYPPVFLLLCVPLGLMPYLLALAVWLGLTALAYLLSIRVYLQGLPWWSALAFPAVLVNLGHGQNGFLTTSLLAAGLFWRDRAPVLAGFILGGLIYKPHMLIIFPFFLLVTQRWRAILGLIMSVFLWLMLSYLVLGQEAWVGFFSVSSLAQQALEQEWVGSAKMQSVFAALRLWGAPLWLAYGAQGASAGVALGLLLWLSYRKHLQGALEPALIVLLLVLSSPFLLDYDLMILAIPLAVLASIGLKTGFLPYEKTVLVAGFILPLLSRSVAMGLSIPIAPWVFMALMAVIVRRLLQKGRKETALSA